MKPGTSPVEGFGVSGVGTPLPAVIFFVRLVLGVLVLNCNDESHLLSLVKFSFFPRGYRSSVLIPVSSANLNHSRRHISLSCTP
jgi:hypothetical protein